jgi:hypothetical protein
MKATIQLHDFIHCGALKDNFSYAGLVALFDYIEDYERDCGTEFDFDPVALRCAYTEYNNIKDAYENYLPADGSSELDMLEYLQNNTQVIEFENGVILQDF